MVIFRLRSDGAYGTDKVPEAGAPLISQLKNEEPLSAWGIWSIFNEWHNDHSDLGDGKTTPRDLRAAYLDFIYSDGEMRLRLACIHGGMSGKRVQAGDGDIPERMIAAVNEQIRTYLQSNSPARHSHAA